MWPKFSNPEVSSESIPSFAGSRLTFQKLSLDLVEFLGKPIAKSLRLRMAVSFDVHDKPTFCVCSDDGVSLWMRPWGGSKFSVSRGLQLSCRDFGFGDNYT